MQTTRAPGSTGGTNSTPSAGTVSPAGSAARYPAGVGPELLEPGEHGDLRAVLGQRRDLHGAAVPADADDPHAGFLLDQVPPQEGDGAGQRVGGRIGGAEPHVVGAVVDVQLDVGQPQAGEPLALHARDEPVGPAVQQQERRRGGGDVADRAGLRRAVGHARRRARRAAAPRGWCASAGSVPRSVANAARSLGAYQAATAATALDGPVTPTSPSRAGSVDQAEQLGQVPTGGLAPGGDPVRVDAELVGARPQPADGGLGVVQLGRPDRLAGEPVVDAGHRDAGLRHLLERVRVGAAVGRAGGVPAAQPPAAAVQEDDDRRGRRVRGEVQVELQRPRRRAAPRTGRRTAPGRHRRPGRGGAAAPRAPAGGRGSGRRGHRVRRPATGAAA